MYFRVLVTMLMCLRPCCSEENFSGRLRSRTVSRVPTRSTLLWHLGLGLDHHLCYGTVYRAVHLMADASPMFPPGCICATTCAVELLGSLTIVKQCTLQWCWFCRGPSRGDVSELFTGCAHNASQQHRQRRSDPDSCSVDEEAEKEPVQKVELKGDDKTDILFSGKTTFRTKLTDAANPWTPATAGALTVRKDKASGAAWLQVNNESKVCPLNSFALHALLQKHACACCVPVV
jgi:hypothetical protein